EAAVGGVVTEPCDLADGGIVVRELDCAHVPSGTVDQQPRAALPDPVIGGRGRLFAGEFVIDAQGTTHHEAAVGYVVGVSGGPLLDRAIDDQGTDLERFFAGSGAGRVTRIRVCDF